MGVGARIGVRVGVRDGVQRVKVGRDAVVDADVRACRYTCRDASSKTQGCSLRGTQSCSLRDTGLQPPGVMRLQAVVGKGVRARAGVLAERARCGDVDDA